ncbi:hypothetical protein MMH89_03290 [Candidatus Comchoanobacter bicostacola]|uniref:Uncharacterized protein n=1 Tax=Candidatus Comchoanobacter bicostacola TaxID=2919598 RepID=A0ABY5DKA6_9GAMM|nr:hypothetical protein [Candidatus Comchoanobacter bicostacola]UTC24247.1 hypothetical protein MMH89_03290 [Candidatus Comchoanobacter bicostacola]
MFSGLRAGKSLMKKLSPVLLELIFDLLLLDSEDKTTLICGRINEYNPTNSEVPLIANIEKAIESIKGLIKVRKDISTDDLQIAFAIQMLAVEINKDAPPGDSPSPIETRLLCEAISQENPLAYLAEKGAFRDTLNQVIKDTLANSIATISSTTQVAAPAAAEDNEFDLFNQLLDGLLRNQQNHVSTDLTKWREAFEPMLGIDAEQLQSCTESAGLIAEEWPRIQGSSPHVAKQQDTLNLAIACTKEYYEYPADAEPHAELVIQNLRRTINYINNKPYKERGLNFCTQVIGETLYRYEFFTPIQYALFINTQDPQVPPSIRLGFFIFAAIFCAAGPTSNTSATNIRSQSQLMDILWRNILWHVKNNATDHINFLQLAQIIALAASDVFRTNQSIDTSLAEQAGDLLTELATHKIHPNAIIPFCTGLTVFSFNHNVPKKEHMLGIIPLFECSTELISTESPDEPDKTSIMRKTVEALTLAAAYYQNYKDLQEKQCPQPEIICATRVLFNLLRPGYESAFDISNGDSFVARALVELKKAVKESPGTAITLESAKQVIELINDQKTLFEQLSVLALSTVSNDFYGRILAQPSITNPIAKGILFEISNNPEVWNTNDLRAMFSHAFLPDETTEGQPVEDQQFWKSLMKAIWDQLPEKTGSFSDIYNRLSHTDAPLKQFLQFTMASLSSDYAKHLKLGTFYLPHKIFASLANPGNKEDIWNAKSIPELISETLKDNSNPANQKSDNFFTRPTAYTQKVLKVVTNHPPIRHLTRNTIKLFSSHLLTAHIISNTTITAAVALTCYLSSISLYIPYLALGFLSLNLFSIGTQYLFAKLFLNQFKKNTPIDQVFSNELIDKVIKTVQTPIPKSTTPSPSTTPAPGA